jgi:uncharacterized caspase-like protein
MPLINLRSSFAKLVGFIVLALALTFATGAAMAQSKRIGLVIGLADYGDTRHPTAVQDAGLVAQSLKQAGFELTEAANVSQNEFRTLFRDFATKAGAAGPDAVIAVYIAGVGLQDDAENYLLPVGARLSQRSDLSIEGLRLSDFLRAIEGVPAAGRVVMLDLAYAHPFAQLVADGGRGLAPVEKRDGMLIAYNQSPNQDAELPQTNYGSYAMALAEALREPGLDLNAAFERVRLRVHDMTEGKETPWEVNGITTPIVLVSPQPGQPVAAAPAPKRPIAELDDEAAYARAVEIDTIVGYEEFIRVHPNHAQARRVRAVIATRREAFYWQRARRANTSRAYWTYLKRYPRGSHAGEAEERLSRLSAPIAPPNDFEEVIYDDLPPPRPEEVEVYEDVVVEDRWNALPPPRGFRDVGLPPPPVHIIDLAPPPPPSSSRVLPSVVIGAGIIGAAILANRAWRRPPTVRPPVVPPISRPGRPPRPGFGGRPGFDGRPGVPGGRPGFDGPGRPNVGAPGAIRPGIGAPGVGGPGRRPPPGAIRPGTTQPIVVTPPVGGAIQPPVTNPATGPGTRPGRGGPNRPAIGAPATGGTVQPSVTNPTTGPGTRPGRGGPNRPAIGAPATGGTVQPLVTNPTTGPGTRPGRGGSNRPTIGTPPGGPGAGSGPVTRPGTRPGRGGSNRPTIGTPPGGPGAGSGPVTRPGIGPGRTSPGITPPTTTRPAPTITRPVAPTITRPTAPITRPPTVRPAPTITQPPPVARPAPVARPPATRPPPAARPPAAARPAPAVPPVCTPQMRAARQC